VRKNEVASVKIENNTNFLYKQIAIWVLIPLILTFKLQMKPDRYKSEQNFRSNRRLHVGSPGWLRLLVDGMQCQVVGFCGLQLSYDFLPFVLQAGDERFLVLENGTKPPFVVRSQQMVPVMQYKEPTRWQA
jgi:hypothetical protein